MPRYIGSHRHNCVNKAAGCHGSYECSNQNLERNYDPDGAVCGINPMDDQECEDCYTSRCSECGSVLNIERCDQDCPKFTQV